MAGSRDRGGAARQRGEAAGAPGLRQRRPTAGSLLRSRSSLRSAGHGPGPGRVEEGSRGGIPEEGLERPAAAPEAQSAEAAAGAGREKDRSQRHAARSSAHCMPGDVVLRHGFVLRGMPGDEAFRPPTASRWCSSAPPARR